MRENLNAIKRLVAFTLTVLLLGTTIWNDVFVIATEENNCSEYVDEQTYAARILQPVGEGDGYCDHCGQVEQSHIHEVEEPAEEVVAAEETQPVEEVLGDAAGDTSVPADPQPASDNPEEAVPNPDNEEGISQEDTPVIDDENSEETPEEDIEDTDKKEEDEEDKEEEDCEHEWVYTSNGDGTHVKKCSKCDEESTEECTFDEDGKCIYCGYEKEEECQHEWEYISNNNGTHVKKCKNCGEEIEEACELDENGLCHLCGYEDERLIYQTYSRTLHGVKVTVAGMIPRGANVTIFTKPLENANRIVNQNLEEGIFNALEVFDIDIYYRSGDKYQPDDAGETLDITFAGIDELDEVDDDKEIVVYRLEEDETVTEMESEVVGEDVVFEAEHFTEYAVGVEIAGSYESWPKWQKLAYIGTTTANYTLINKVNFGVRFTGAEEVQFKVYLYKNLQDMSDPTSGDEEPVAVVTKDCKVTGATDVEIEAVFDYTGNDNKYITKGKGYSIVIETTKATKVRVGRNSLVTFTNQTSGEWSANSTFKGVFDIDSSTESAISDSYSISGIKATKGDASGTMSTTTDKPLIYGKKDTDTLKAVFNADVDRTVSWSSDKPAVVSVNEDTGEIEALETGEAIITAKYTDTKTYSITVKVVKIEIDGWDPDGSTAQHAIYYTGDVVQVPVVAYIGTSGLSLGTPDYENAVKASTTADSIVRVSYVANNKTYKFERKFMISPLALSASMFPSATTDITILNGEISAFTGLVAYTSNAGKSYAKDVTPAYNADNKDFSVNIDETKVVSNGISYEMTITGKNNFSGTLTGITVIKKNLKIDDVLGVRLSATSRLSNYFYDATTVELTPKKDSNDVIIGWEEVTFYRKDTNADVNGIVTPSTIKTMTITNAKGETDGKSAGQQTITFTMDPDKSGYTGSLSVSFNIQPNYMSKTKIVWKDNKKDFAHTGNPIEPKPGTDLTATDVDFIVTIENNQGTQDVTVPVSDYNVSYSGNHKDIGTYQITLTGKGNFDSNTSQDDTYKIIADYTMDMKIRIYDGTYHDGIAPNYATGYQQVYDPTSTGLPDIRVYMPGKGDLNKGTDYTLEVYNDAACTNKVTDNVPVVGTKYIKVTPTDSLKTTYPTAAEVTGTYTVVPCPLTDANISVVRSKKTFTYTGENIELVAATSTSDPKEIMVKYGTGSNVLTAYTNSINPYDYKITYSNNINVGTATYVIEAKKDASGNYTGNYSGKIEVAANSFTIEPASLSTGGTAEVEASPLTFVYSGKAHVPSNIVVKIGNKEIAADNYTVTASNNIAVTTSTKKALLTVEGKNNLTGSVTIPFEITRNTDSYLGITIGGKAVNISSPYSTQGTAATGITRIYKLDDLDITYDGTLYNGPVTVYGTGPDGGAKELNLPGETIAYDAEYFNVDKAANYDIDNNPDGSPRLVITGLNNYAGNDAIVYFNIKSRNIEDAEITEATDWKVDYPDDPSEVGKPTVTVIYNGATLTENQDYSVTCYDDYDTAGKTGTTAQPTSGPKYAVIRGMGNYEGEVVHQYFVGIDVADVKITLQNPLVSSDATYASGSSVRWLNGKAPKVILSWDGKTATEWFNETPEAGDPSYSTANITFNAVEDTTMGLANKYDSRPAGSRVDKFNTITLSMEGVGGAYYGSKEYKYQILPVSVAKVTSGRGVKYDTNESETPVSYYYTGSPLTPKAKAYYYYKDVTDEDNKVVLTKDDDYYFNKDTLGPEPTASLKNDLLVIGCGNYDQNSSQDLTYQVIAGKVKVFKDVYKDDETAPNNFLFTADGNTQYTLTDVITYDGTEIKPDITITAENGVSKLKPNVDYTINYKDENGGEDLISPGPKTITIVVTNAYYKPATITINYTILKNTIESFKAELTGVYYAAVAQLDATTIKNKIENNNDPTSIVVSSTNKTLKYGEDYEIVTTDELSNIKNQDKYKNETSIIGANSHPSYKTMKKNGTDTDINWIYIKGKGTYSEYLKVPFSIVLDIGSSTYATVGISASSYNLNENGIPETTVVPRIWYRTPGASSGYGSELTDVSFELGSETLYNYDNSGTTGLQSEKNPGPATDLTVTGKNACSGTTSYTCKYKTSADDDGTEVCFKVALGGTKRYQGINMTSPTSRDYTGNALKPTFSYLTGATSPKEVIGTNVNVDGDYKILYVKAENYNTISNITSISTGNIGTLPTDEPVDVGTWYAVIVPTSNSKYFIDGQTSEKIFEFKIRYNLAKATMKFLDGGSNEITEYGYTGSTIYVPAYVTIGNKVLYKGELTSATQLDGETYIKIKESSVIAKGEYTIVASSTNQDLAYGSCSAKFTITGVALLDSHVKFKTGTNTSADTYSTSFTGSDIEPEMVVTVGSAELIKGTDYEVTYTRNRDANAVDTADEYKPTVIVKGINAYRGSVTKHFDITPVPITDTMITVDEEDAYYRGPGVAVEPAVTVQMSNGYVLRSGSDYEKITSDSYNSNKSGETVAASVKVTAGPSGNFTGTDVVKSFAIKKLDLRRTNIKITPNTTEFTNAVIDLSSIIEVTVDGQPLLSKDADTSQGKTAYDYDIEVYSGSTKIDDLVDKGSYTVKIVGYHNCESFNSEIFTVTERSLPNNYHYYFHDNEEQGEWKYLTDMYPANTSDNRPGFVTTGAFYSETDPKKITDSLEIKIFDVTTVSDDASQNIPEIIILDKEVIDRQTNNPYQLTSADYEITAYGNNDKAGTAAWSKTNTVNDYQAEVAAGSPYITITGKGNYTGTLTLPFNLGKNIVAEGFKVFFRTTNSSITTDYEYKEAQKDSVGWYYKYNGEKQIPEVILKNANDKVLGSKNYDVTITDLNGDTDSSINAGYKYISVTGKGDYCGSFTQKYSIHRKDISANIVKTNNLTMASGTALVPGAVFSNEEELIATDTGAATGTELLKFTVDENILTRLSTTTIEEHLVDTGLLNSTDAVKFENYYYTVFDGETIQPDVIVEDSQIGREITKDDIEIKVGPTQNSWRTVSTYTTDSTANKNLTNYVCSEMIVHFTGTSEDDFSGGNYYVPGGASSSFTIQFLILAHNIEDDFDVIFPDTLNGENQTYKDGSEIEPTIEVKRGSYVLEKDTDYEVSYLDKNGKKTNIYPGVALLTVTGIGNFRGTKIENFYIWGDLAKTKPYYYDSVTKKYKEGAPIQTYTGLGITYGEPRIYLGLQGENGDIYILEKERHYEPSSNPTSIDEFVTDGTVYYKGIQREVDPDKLEEINAEKDVSLDTNYSYWTGDLSVNYDVKFDHEVKATIDKKVYEYTGYDIIPVVGVDVSTANIDSVKYDRVDKNGKVIKSNLKVGEDDFTSLQYIKVTVHYIIISKTGYASVIYQIAPRSIKNCKVVYANPQRYTGRNVAPSVFVYIESIDYQTGYANELFELTEGTDYTLDYHITNGVGNVCDNYDSDKREGSGSFTITGITDEVIDSDEKPYKIKMQSIANLRVTDNTGDTLTVEWVREIYSSGTILQLQTLNSAGDYETVASVTVTGKTSLYKFTDLTSSTNYQIVATAYGVLSDNTIIKSDDKSIQKTTDVSTTSIKVTSPSAGRVSVTWSKTTDVILYHIYCKDISTGEEDIVAIIPASTGAYTDTANAGRYTYRIVGFALVNGKLEAVNTSQAVEVVVE